MAVILERKPLTFAERTYLPQIAARAEDHVQAPVRAERTRCSIPSSGRRSRRATAACRRW